jgi:hypothetical protein
VISLPRRGRVATPTKAGGAGWGSGIGEFRYNNRDNADVFGKAIADCCGIMA